MTKDNIIWELKAKDGRKVTVKYKSHFFSDNSICCHLEFNGYAISETGYKSHFFGGVHDKEKPNVEKVKKLAINLIEEFYIPPQQIGLL